MQQAVNRRARVHCILQNDFKIRAAFSHSLSRVVGQYTSFPILDVVGLLVARLLVVVAQLKTLLMALGLPSVAGAAALFRSHEGSSADTRCMLRFVVFLHADGPREFGRRQNIMRVVEPVEKEW